MLQIVTGRFFGDGPVNEGEFDAILYSNFSCVRSIGTTDAELHPSDARGTRVSSYVLRYTVRYETHPRDILVLPIGYEVAEHFRLLAGLWFQAYFHPDRYHVEMLCRSDPRQSRDYGVPSRFVDAFFDAPSLAKADTVEKFQAFIKKVVGMPRKSYRLFMSCLAAFFDALEAIDTNRDLAYSMFVYVLEGLTQGADDFAPTWNDYPQDTRLRLDKELKQISEDRATAIREILTKIPHLKLMKRFIEFTSSLINDSFFTSEAVGRGSTLCKNELHQTLGNLYKTRSGYVHALTQIQEHLRIPDWNREIDVFHWEHEPHLTFSGVVRLCRHVLLSFVERQTNTDKEKYPHWRNELPGFITAEFAPHLWIGRAETFRPEFAAHRFNGFVEHLTTHLQESPLKLPDVRPLVEAIEKAIPNAREGDRKIMVCLYYLYHRIVPPEHSRTKWSDVVTSYKDDLDECSIPVMASFVIILEQFCWPADECESVFEKYLKRKFKPNALNLPRIIEIAVMAEIANLHLGSGNDERYRYWVDRAILDAAGREGVQTYLQKCRDERKQLSNITILGIPASAILKSQSDEADASGENRSAQLEESAENINVSAEPNASPNLDATNRSTEPTNEK